MVGQAQAEVLEEDGVELAVPVLPGVDQHVLDAVGGVQSAHHGREPDDLRAGADHGHDLHVTRPPLSRSEPYATRVAGQAVIPAQAGMIRHVSDDVSDEARQGEAGTRTAAEPTPPPETGDPLKVLFVCTANICRSAYAEVAARHLVGSRTDVVFSSAGTHGLQVAAAEPRHREFLPEGVAHDDFASRKVTRELIDERRRGAHRGGVAPGLPDRGVPARLPQGAHPGPVR